MQPDEQVGFQQPYNAPITDLTKKGPRKAIIFLIIAGVLLLLMFIANIILGSGGGSSAQYVKLGAQHTELLRVIDVHEDKARSLDTRNYFARARIILISSKNDFSEFLSSRYGTGISAEAQALATDAGIDNTLERAAIANTFDEDFNESYGAKVNDSLQLAKQLDSEATSDTNKNFLAEVIAIYQSLK